MTTMTTSTTTHAPQLAGVELLQPGAVDVEGRLEAVRRGWDLPALEQLRRQRDVLAEAVHLRAHRGQARQHLAQAARALTV